MFPTRSPWFALIANFFLAWALFALFMKMGWINIASDLPLWQIVLFTGLINIVTMLIVRVIELLALPLIVIFAACTLGFGLLLWPGIAMYGVLYLTGMITGFFTLTTIWWQALILGTAFGLLRFSLASND